MIVKDGPFGGSNGKDWTDGDETYLNGPITGIEIRHDKYIDSIKIRYGDVWGDEHGWHGGNLKLVNLQPGEDIVGIAGMLVFLLSNNRVLLYPFLILIQIRKNSGRFSRALAYEVNDFPR